MLLTLAIIVALALLFDYINGFHDTANAIATVVSTGVLSARNAIIMAAILNFGGALLGVQVATTIAKGIADSSQIVPVVVISALVAAIAWNLITWYFGIPSSSSHALVGGLAVLWWAWADSSGYTKQRAIDKENKRKAARIERQRESIGMPSRRKK